MGPRRSNGNINVGPSSMTKELVPNELWMFIDPLLPPEPPKPNGGRPRVPDRAALAAIIYVLKSGIPWGRLPRELGFGSGVTCWRRLRHWQKASNRPLAASRRRSTRDARYGPPKAPFFYVLG